MLDMLYLKKEATDMNTDKTLIDIVDVMKLSTFVEMYNKAQEAHPGKLISISMVIVFGSGFYICRLISSLRDLNSNLVNRKIAHQSITSISLSVIGPGLDELPDIDIILNRENAPASPFNQELSSPTKFATAEPVVSRFSADNFCSIEKRMWDAIERKDYEAARKYRAEYLIIKERR